MVNKYFVTSNCSISTGKKTKRLYKGDILVRKGKSWYKIYNYWLEIAFMRQKSTTFHKFIETGKLVPWSEAVEILYGGE